MKTMIKMMILPILLFISISNMDAQDREGAATYQLEFNQGNYEMMVKQAGEKGMSVEALGKWLAENGNAVLEMEEAESAPERAQLTVYIVGEHGIIGKDSTPMRIADRPVPLGRLLSVEEIVRVLKNAFPDTLFFPDANFFPGDTLFPDSHFFPDANFITTASEVERMAVEAGRRALSMTDMNEKGFAFFITITPEFDRFKFPVNLGNTTFTGGNLNPPNSV